VPQQQPVGDDSGAREDAFTLDEKIKAAQVKANVTYLEQKRDLLHRGPSSARRRATRNCQLHLIGLDAERHKADLDTDAVAMFAPGRCPTADGPSALTTVRRCMPTATSAARCCAARASTLRAQR
jgi:hypothetical protein